MGAVGAASAGRPSFLTELERDLEERRAESLWRVRRELASPQGRDVVVNGRSVLAFASNDYLGLAAHPEIVAALATGAARWGVGSGASHLVAGHFAPHAALEAELAAFVAPCEGARAVVFSSGYLANLALLTALADRHAAVFADRLNHACLNDGALLSRAELIRYAHLDLVALQSRLERSPARRKIIATDAVFSMDGEVAPVRELLALAERHEAILVIDDAHGFGVLGDGRGTAAEYALASERLVIMGTLGKAAGVAGAFAAGHPAVIETLVQRARSYIYTTAAPPALAVALSTSLRLVRDAHEQRAHLRTLVARWRAGARSLPWRLGTSSTPIQPLVVGDNETALALSAALWERGMWVPAIRPPTVPAGTARLRVSLSAAHRVEDIDALLAALGECAGAMPRSAPVA